MKILVYSYVNTPFYIGACELDGNYLPQKLSLLGRPPDRSTQYESLLAWSKACRKVDQLYTYEDGATLRQLAFNAGVPLTWLFDNPPCCRDGEERVPHYDLKGVLASYCGAAPPLSELCTSLGISLEPPVSSAAEASATRKTLATTFILLRWLLFSGELSREAYQGTVQQALSLSPQRDVGLIPPGF